MRFFYAFYKNIAITDSILIQDIIIFYDKYMYIFLFLKMIILI